MGLQALSIGEGMLPEAILSDSYTTYLQYEGCFLHFCFVSFSHQKVHYNVC